ncbi:MAG: (deoxy)nucleoside triphosphate pyrophosphohydrolase [Spirochaetia bacterium]|nr:(deoxy)nucleoside triphosphate pyrophosphohydrolase [Spirochaetia bacterium]
MEHTSVKQQSGPTTRVSTAGIARRRDKFLVALRKPGTSIGESWEFPGGKKEDSETPQQALKREFFEEFSIDILVGEKLCSDQFVNRDQVYELSAYSVRLISDAFVLKEHQEIRWVSLDDLMHMPMADSDKKIVRCLRKSNQMIVP